MISSTSYPRSALHAQAPVGAGTPNVESLLSYACRLAGSHSISMSSLAQVMATTMEKELHEGFKWYERNLSGAAEAAQDWACALSALTGVERLDSLTLLPWRDVLALKGLAATRARWCPQCFAEDLAESRDPYFRLAWDIGAVTACSRHRIVLADTCPDCSRIGTRHKGTYVVPGWCCHCGSFLGAGDEVCQPALPEELWTARQVGLLLAEQGSLRQTPSRQFWRDAMVEVISRMDGGKSAVFARRVGLGKSTLHHWLQQDGVPTLAGSLAIAAHAGLALPALLRGDLSGWTPPQADQLELSLSMKGNDRRATPRHLDWDEIRRRLAELAQAPKPISVWEAGRLLDVDARHLYLRANREARVLGERWKEHLRMNAEARHANARPYVEAACRAVLDEGRAISLRELETRVPKPILASVDSLFDMVDEVRATIHRQS